MKYKGVGLKSNLKISTITQKWLT